jgi:hypothetical protein
MSLNSLKIMIIIKLKNKVLKIYDNNWLNKKNTKK